MNEEKLLELLLEEYPDGKVEDISSKKYYTDIRLLALSNNLKVNMYLKELGFTIVHGSLNEEEAIDELMNAFPDGKIKSIWENHSKAARYLKIIAEKKNKNLNQLLAEYGMEIIRKDYLNSNQVLKELSQAFPDGNLFSLHPKYAKHVKILKGMAKEKGITFEELLKEHGMEIVRKERSRKPIPVEEASLEKEKYLNKNKYDELLMKELVEHYNFIAADYAIYFNVSRQGIASKLRNPKISTFSWKVQEILQEHISFFKQMIKEETAKKESATYFYQILHNKKQNTFALTIFPKDLSNFPMCWKDEDISLEIKQALFKNDFHIFNNTDFKNLQKIRTTTDKEKKNFYALFRTLAQKHYKYYEENNELNKYYLEETKHGNKYEQFAKGKNLGSEWSRDNRFVQKEEIISILEYFKNPTTNIVKIPADAPEYHRIMRLAINRRHSMQTFIESFGYKYKRTRFSRDDFKEKLRQKRIKQLENYKVTSDSVYISSYTKLYNYLTMEARKKGYKLTEYLLKEFKLRRVDIKELPEGYIPYELGNCEEDLEKEEKFLKYIEDYLMLSKDDSYFYISSDSNFYVNISRYTNLIGISNDDFFKKWDLNRLNYQESLNYLINELNFTEEESNEILHRKENVGYYEENDIELKERNEILNNFEIDKRIFDDEFSIKILSENERLDFLEHLSNKVISTINFQEKKKRSQLLVRKMKELYNYKCQLCDPINPIPIIEMKNGLKYVEMHHIIGISNSNAEDESDYLLDNYVNCVIVCSHHHKMLHYHKGGFNELDEMRDGLYFINEETELKIFNNKHLDYPKLDRIKENLNKLT